MKTLRPAHLRTISNYLYNKASAAEIRMIKRRFDRMSKPTKRHLLCILRKRDIHAFLCKLDFYPGLRQQLDKLQEQSTDLGPPVQVSDTLMGLTAQNYKYLVSKWRIPPPYLTPTDDGGVVMEWPDLPLFVTDDNSKLAGIDVQIEVLFPDEKHAAFDGAEPTATTTCKYLVPEEDEPESEECTVSSLDEIGALVSAVIR